MYPASEVKTRAALADEPLVKRLAHLSCVVLAALLARPVSAQGDGEGIPVNEELADMVEEVSAATGISLTIGMQTPTSVNIRKVNGRNVCAPESLSDVERLQLAFERHPNIYRNIGPALVVITGVDSRKKRVSLDELRARGVIAGCPSIYVSVRERTTAPETPSSPARSAPP